ncbi:nucleotidyltransferase domain-containing protein [Dermatophilaceae bacterium Soc4.6]
MRPPTHIELSGSVARGDDVEGSDVDFLPGTDVLDLLGMKRELEAVLGVPVDLVPRHYLSTSPGIIEVTVDRRLGPLSDASIG